MLSLFLSPLLGCTFLFSIDHVCDVRQPLSNAVGKLLHAICTAKPMRSKHGRPATIFRVTFHFSFSHPAYRIADLLFAVVAAASPALIEQSHLKSLQPIGSIAHFFRRRVFGLATLAVPCVSAFCFRSCIFLCLGTLRLRQTRLHDVYTSRRPPSRTSTYRHVFRLRFAR